MTNTLDALPSWRAAFFNELTSRLDLRGKRILEIGSGDCRIARIIVREFTPTFLFATDLKIAERTEGPLLAMSCDATAMPFPTDYFDIVYSHNVFEHITGLEKAWGEIGRVLKPGGKLFTHFAPAWTHAFGHHVYEESENRFHCDISAYGHLYMNRKTLDRIVRRTTRAVSRARLAARTLLFEDGCNRLWPSEYRAIFNQSGPLTVLDQIEHVASHHDRPIPPELLAMYPDVPAADFRVFGWTLLAEKGGIGVPSDADPHALFESYVSSRPAPSLAVRIAKYAKKIRLAI